MSSMHFSGRRSVLIVPCLVAALTAAGMFLPAAQAAPARSAPAPLPMAGQKAEKPMLQILAPTEGAVLPEGKFLVVGRSGFEGKRVDVSVNDSFAGKDTVDRGGYFVPVVLTSGKNTIVARAGGQEASVSVTVGGKPDYIAHPALEKCSGCHSAGEKSFRVQGPKDKVCYRCHQRKDRRKEVHGPMGAGECTACHDPHGSSHKSLTVAEPQALCVLCHDQKSSEKHMKNAKGKACVQCHDPHASDKPYHQK
jgi:predicted CXXCH cytochrome family protein